MLSTPGRIERRLTERLSGSRLARIIRTVSVAQPFVYGNDPGAWGRVSVHRTAILNDALINVTSGRVTIGPHVFFGHSVSLLTGTHDIAKRGAARQQAIPTEGRDIVIEEGAWIASNVVVLGPCRIGAHSVVAAGSVVRDDVLAEAIVAGAPARVVGKVPPA